MRGKVEMAITKMSQPSALRLSLNTSESERTRMERVFIEVPGEEGQSAVILTPGLA